MAEPRTRPPLRGLIDSILAQDLRRGLEDPLDMLRKVREQSPAADVDRALLEACGRYQAGLHDAREHQKELRSILDRLAAPPLFPAVFLGTLETGRGAGALVCLAGQRRIVSFAAQLDPATLAVGDEVLLGHDQNVVLARVASPLPRSGETALFERALEDGRAVLRFREDEIVVRLADSLSGVALERGDPVRWDHAAGLAFERIERSRGRHLFLEQTPSETFADIGGLEHVIRRLQDVVRLHLEHAATARRYRLARIGGVLLTGPPGTGKTMLARALANWLGSISESGRASFMHVRPGQTHSMWFGQSEANIRDAFRAAREAGEADPTIPVVMFWDEVDAIGAARGDHLQRVEDRVLQSFMVEINGFETRGNVLVVGATNRLDALDPALLREGRLGDLVIDVPRPDRRAAHAILARHLNADVPFAGADPERARERLLAAAIGMLFSSDGTSRVATLTFRDGRRHEVRARDLVSGASLARVVREATERAALREIAGGVSGLDASDVEEAVEREIVGYGRQLTPANCRRHLQGLPQDADVVSVEVAPRCLDRHDLRVAESVS